VFDTEVLKVGRVSKYSTC